ncbi:MAG: D-glycero-beta-D-manno-heptose 1-phosphate adenylyltransferase [Schwartzia sp.]|nr:D-glycero-beta-D-manno-heptose 1-phosphate adenylyltransferase [Schwartzia sp. (in: firmicutes)]
MIIPREYIKDACDTVRADGATIVFTNGCFDILHAGHVRYLTAAVEFGDFLVIGLNSDASVRRLKGEGRPVVSEADRAEVLDALRAVDIVTIFDEPTAEELIRLVRPDIYVKGGDYSLDTLPEAEIVQAAGGRVEFIPLVEGRSTTNVIERIKGGT